MFISMKANPGILGQHMTNEHWKILDKTLIEEREVMIKLLNWLASWSPFPY